DLDAVNKAPAIFDIDKLKWMNHKYIVDTDSERLCEQVLPYFKKMGWTQNCDEKTVMIVDTVKGNMDLTLDCLNVAKPFFEGVEFPDSVDDQRVILTNEAIATFKYIIEHIDQVNFTKDDIESFLQGLKEATGIPGKKLYHPIRVALFGSRNGPELWKVFLSLGREDVKKRLKAALAEVENRLGTL
ncbi:MAG: glutamate--tRNA ligase, partial [Caldisericaceae bacterium]